MDLKISEAIATYSSRRHLYSTGWMNSFALSLRTIKLRQFNICYATETRFSSSKQDLLSSKQPPGAQSIIQEESKRASLIIMPLNLEEEQAEKLKRMAAWQVRSQTRVRTAIRSVQVSTIHTVSKVISGQDITSITNLFLWGFHEVYPQPLVHKRKAQPLNHKLIAIS